MKKLVFLIAVIACTIQSFAQKINVAVYAPQKTNEIFDKSTTDFIVGEFVSNITHSDNYIAVNRSNEFLQAITKEHQFDQSGMVDEKEIAQLGKQKGAELICVVIFRKVLGNNTIEARILDVEGATVIESDLRDLSNIKDVKQIKSTVAAIVTTLLTNTTSEKNNSGSKSTRLASANERLYYVKGDVQGYSDGRMVKLSHQEVLTRMVDNPEALSLYNEGWTLVQDRWGARFASVYLFCLIGVPAAVLSPMLYTNLIESYHPALYGSIMAGTAAIFTTWFAVELSLKSSAKNKMKKAVNKYNDRTTYMTIGVSPDRMGLVFNF